jgi:hypothetical protein
MMRFERSRLDSQTFSKLRPNLIPNTRLTHEFTERQYPFRSVPWLARARLTSQAAAKDPHRT